MSDVEPDLPAPAGTHAADTRASVRRISRLGLLIAVGGALVQLLLGLYYLAMAHAPAPHDLPVGVVASAEQRQQLTARLEDGGRFQVDDYADAAALTRAIERREAYGGIAIEGTTPTLYVAGAAAPAVATLLRTTFDQTYQQQLKDQVTQLTQAGSPVPAATVTALTTPPTVVDVVPLPDDDRAGSSLGFMIQALCLGGSIASLALGRLGRLTVRSPRRGVGHAALLVVYALASAGVAMLALRLFGVTADADTATLFLGLALISLAVTASTAAAVALVGPAGSLLGALYFTLGLVISGSSIAPEMLPDVGRRIGQALPPGAGATVVRDALYFPDAATGGPLLVLGAFAAVGLVVVLVTNARANPSSHRSALHRA